MLPDSPEMRSAHRRALPPPLAVAGGSSIDAALLDMHSAIGTGTGPPSAFSGAFNAHMEPLQVWLGFQLVLLQVTESTFKQVMP